MEKEKMSLMDRRNFLKLGLLSTASVLSTKPAIAARDSSGGTANNGKVNTPLQKYAAKNYEHLLGGKLSGISDGQLKAHFGLYENYINKINEFEAKIKSFDTNNPNTIDYRGWHVDQTFMLNGAVLHEFYFSNLGITDKEPKGSLKKIIERDFSSLQNFIGHLKLVGKVMRGWSMAAFNYRTGKLNVYGLDQHNQLVPAFVYPVLVLDVYEHAYMIDYGTDRKKYLDAFIANLNWKSVHERLENALSMPFGDVVTV